MAFCGQTWALSCRWAGYGRHWRLMTIGLLVTSLLLGLRHGVDWDHIAAIADLNTASDSRRRGFMLSLSYSLGHGVVVLALGSVLIFAGATIPEGLDHWMGRVVGITLIALGLVVLYDLIANKGTARLRSRWMLILDGTFAGLRRVRALGGGRRITVEHTHPHQHEQDFDHADPPAHDHAHQRHEAALATPALVGSGASEPSAPVSHAHAHAHHLDLPQHPPAAHSHGVATGIGMLHGVGIESPTQMAAFVASASVVSRAAGFGLLAVWVLGLVVANAFLALAAGRGLLRPDGNVWIHRGLALFVAIGSIAMGTWYLTP